MLEQELKLSVEGAFVPDAPARGHRRVAHRGAARPRSACHVLRHAGPAARTSRRHAAQSHGGGGGRELDRQASGRRRHRGRSRRGDLCRRRARGPARRRRPRDGVRALREPHAGGSAAHAPAALAPARPRTGPSWPSSSTTAYRCSSEGGSRSASARSRSRDAAIDRDALERIAGIARARRCRAG